MRVEVVIVEAAAVVDEAVRIVLRVEGVDVAVAVADAEDGAVRVVFLVDDDSSTSLAMRD